MTNTSRYSSWVLSDTPAQDFVALIFSNNTKILEVEGKGKEEVSTWVSTEFVVRW